MPMAEARILQPKPPQPVPMNALPRSPWPALPFGLWALGLFVLGLALAEHFQAPLLRYVEHWKLLGEFVFVLSSALAVLLPAASNLALLPLAVAAWGPLPAAGWLLLGWTLGSVLAFALARTARPFVLRHWPGVAQVADVERLVHQQHRLFSLVVLRMSFPVDVLSHALGLFGRHTTAGEVGLSTALGAAPFALLFAYVPTLPLAMQALVLVLSALAFVAHACWVQRRARARGDAHARRGARACLSRRP